MSPIGCGLSFDYYWRDYIDDIPRDAVEGGRDSGNKTTYIGQALVTGRGIIPVTIYPGETWVTAAVYGVHRVNTYIRILCSSAKEDLRWIKANSANFHVQTTNKHLVRGGVERDIVSYIGRIRYQDQTLVGKIRPLDIGNALFYFPTGNQEKTVNTYEVLIFDNKSNFQKF